MTGRAPEGAAGHRDRLRERFRRAGAEGLQDYELIELVLFNAIPRVDVKPLAKRLLKRFGGVAGVLTTPEGELVEAVEGPVPEGRSRRRKATTENLVTQLALTRALGVELARAPVKERAVLSSWTALLAYCQAHVSHDGTEQFRVLYLDNKNGLIRDEQAGRGTVNQAPVYPREVVKRALALDAAAMILVHNHPSGDPTPSRADVAVTGQVVRAAEAVGIKVHDHLVVGRGKQASLRQLGLM